jgi:NDP-sugar pyrophosphorylase family protein
MRRARGLILAAGLGTRMAPLTDSLPKPLLPVLNQPLITHVIRRLRDAGVVEIAINVHHRAADVIDCVGDGSRFGVQISWLVERELLGTGGVLKTAAGFWGDADLIVCAADLLSTVDLNAMVDFHRRAGTAACVAAYDHPWPLEEWAGDVAVTQPGTARVAELQLCPGADAKSRLACVGLWVLAPAARDALPAADRFDLRADVLTRLVPAGGLSVFAAEFEFADLGRPEVFLTGTTLALEGRLGIAPAEPPTGGGAFVHPSARIAPTAELRGAVVIGAHAEIADGARIVGPTVIGGGCSVGRYASIAASVVMPGTAVATGAVVANAFLGDRDATAPAVRAHHWGR